MPLPRKFRQPLNTDERTIYEALLDAVIDEYDKTPTHVTTAKAASSGKWSRRKSAPRDAPWNVNCFMVFSNRYRSILRSHLPAASNGVLSEILSHLWSVMPANKKEEYKALAFQMRQSFQSAVAPHQPNDAGIASNICHSVSPTMGSGADYFNKAAPGAAGIHSGTDVQISRHRPTGTAVLRLSPRSTEADDSPCEAFYVDKDSTDSDDGSNTASAYDDSDSGFSEPTYSVDQFASGRGFRLHVHTTAASACQWNPMSAFQSAVEDVSGADNTPRPASASGLYLGNGAFSSTTFRRTVGTDPYSHGGLQRAHVTAAGGKHHSRLESTPAEVRPRNLQHAALLRDQPLSRTSSAAGQQPYDEYTFTSNFSTYTAAPAGDSQSAEAAPSVIPGLPSMRVIDAAEFVGGACDYQANPSDALWKMKVVLL